MKSQYRTPSWIVRPYQPDDGEGVSSLFQSVFGRSAPTGYWEWKLHHLPTKTENEWVAEARGKIVGHYAVMPLRFKILEREALVPHGCDAMTHAEYRRQGILTALGRRANEMWERDGAPFQIGFHYEGWGSVRERLGWRPVSRLVWMKYWLKPFAALAKQFRLADSNVCGSADAVFNRLVHQRKMDPRTDRDAEITQLEHIAHCDERFDQLWAKTSPLYSLLVIRDRAWVKWRYLDMPGAELHVILATRRDEPIGYITFRVAREGNGVRAAVLDCFFAPAEAATAGILLARAISEVAAMGAHSIAALAKPDSAWFRILVQSGFWRGRHGFDFSIIPYASSVHEWTACDWLVTGCEGDVI